MRLLITLLALSLTFMMANQTFPDHIHKGRVLEILDTMGYNYLKVDENQTIRWVAIAKAPVKVGDIVGYDTKTIMQKYKSKTLNREFDEIIFANEVYLPQHSKGFSSLRSSLEDIAKKHETIKPMNNDFEQKEFYTVEEVHKFRKELNGKKIKVKAKVYKVAYDIMKLDWVHLGDGTGDEKLLTDDLVVTTPQSNLKAGQEVTATTTVVIDKDFGYGYFYQVIGEKSTFK